MEDKLGKFLSTQVSVEFEWGQSDCLQFLGLWDRFSTGRERTQYLAGICSTEQEALDYLASAGGELALLTKLFGAKHNGEAQRGDIGLIPTPKGLLGGIYTGRLWVSRFPGRGLSYVKTKADHIWRL
ncbi:hypothetical protein PsAD5_02908 [Pseudovibrio sp. Ad5]|uniref:DUF6950 family protein n=1 Tax=Pseudovibrio sp. Ad5 TaxID=989436 RepID=UPI0007AEAD6E|nr:hypothetical protein [Pseudovibrio sp. Ad5]KZK95144.1 hypothetical protein PsAD5_02908 [Pseudovibrio sp. Ad5]